MYTVSDLHLRFHGSLYHDDVPSHSLQLSLLSIQNSTINPQSTSKHCIQNDNIGYVAYTGSHPTQLLERWFLHGLAHFHWFITEHLLGGGKMDPVHTSVYINDAGVCTNLCLHFEFERLQLDSNTKTQITKNKNLFWIPLIFTSYQLYSNMDSWLWWMQVIVFQRIIAQNIFMITLEPKKIQNTNWRFGICQITINI